MTGSPDWEQTRATITAHLDADEPVETMFTALVPPPDLGDGGFTIGGLIILVLAVSHLMWRSAIRKASQAAGVPLTKRMIIALTPRRLTIWRSDGQWHLGEYLGELPRDQVWGTDVSGTGPRSRMLTLRLSTGAGLTLKVARSVADRLTELIPGQHPAH